MITARHTFRVPHGYHLASNTKRTRYLYVSRWVSVYVDVCHGYDDCDRGIVDLRMKERLFGGDSHRWDLRLQARYRSANPIDAWAYGRFFCGVQIPDAPNKLCHYQDASAMNSGHPRWYVGHVDSADTLINKTFNGSFGRKHRRLKKFPLVKALVIFDCGPCDNYSGPVVKFRGWDIWKGKYHGEDWHLAPVSRMGPT